MAHSLAHGATRAQGETHRNMVAEQSSDTTATMLMPRAPTAQLRSSTRAQPRFHLFLNSVSAKLQWHPRHLVQEYREVQCRYPQELARRRRVDRWVRGQSEGNGRACWMTSSFAFRCCGDPVSRKFSFAITVDRRVDVIVWFLCRERSPRQRRPSRPMRSYSWSADVKRIMKSTGMSRQFNDLLRGVSMHTTEENPARPLLCGGGQLGLGAHLWRRLAGKRRKLGRIAGARLVVEFAWCLRGKTQRLSQEEHEEHQFPSRCGFCLYLPTLSILECRVFLFFLSSRSFAK